MGNTVAALNTSGSAPPSRSGTPAPNSPGFRVNDNVKKEIDSALLSLPEKQQVEWRDYISSAKPADVSEAKWQAECLKLLKDHIKSKGPNITTNFYKNKSSNANVKRNGATAPEIAGPVVPVVGGKRVIKRARNSKSKRQTRRR
jgi:hypothetical protein